MAKTALEDDLIITDMIKPKTGDTISVYGNFVFNGKSNRQPIIVDELLQRIDIDIDIDKLTDIKLNLTENRCLYTIYIKVYGVDDTVGFYKCEFYYDRKNKTKLKILDEVKLFDHSIMQFKIFEKDMIKCEWIKKKNFKKMSLMLYSKNVFSDI